MTEKPQSKRGEGLSMTERWQMLTRRRSFDDRKSSIETPGIVFYEKKISTETPGNVFNDRKTSTETPGNVFNDKKQSWKSPTIILLKASDVGKNGFYSAKRTFGIRRVRQRGRKKIKIPIVY